MPDPWAVNTFLVCVGLVLFISALKILLKE